jgi:hypothetical protein
MASKSPDSFLAATGYKGAKFELARETHLVAGIGLILKIIEVLEAHRNSGFAIGVFYLDRHFSVVTVVNIRRASRHVNLFV